MTKNNLIPGKIYWTRNQGPLEFIGPLHTRENTRFEFKILNSLAGARCIVKQEDIFLSEEDFILHTLKGSYGQRT